MNNEKIQKAVHILRKDGLNPNDVRFLETLTESELYKASPPIKQEKLEIMEIDTAAELKKRLAERGETIEQFNARIEAQKEAIRKEERELLNEQMNRNTALNWIKKYLYKNINMYMRVMQKMLDIPVPTENTALCGKTGTGKTTEMYATILKLSATHALDVEGVRISYADKPRILYLPFRGRMQDRLFWQPSEYHKELSEYFYTPFEWVFIDDFMIQDFTDTTAKGYFHRFLGMQWEHGAKFYYTCNINPRKDEQPIKKFAELFENNATLYDRMKPAQFDFVRFMGKSFR